MEETIKDILDSPDFKEYISADTPKQSMRNLSNFGSIKESTDIKFEIEEEEQTYETGDESCPFMNSKTSAEDLT